MEANEAPEKIYIPLNCDALIDALSDEMVGEIQYTRTDAFIEKACDAYCKVCDTQECEGICKCIWVQRFRKQLMK